MSTAIQPLDQPVTECPKVPENFGQDGGKFYYFYDQLADELDEDLVKRLKSQLDSILIFAGLFAGVNSAFLALTLPMMSADPADDTNALLLQLVVGGSSNITSAGDLPSAKFTPPWSITPVNILFAVSLTFALLSSFLAVLGQQWLVYYRKRSGGGAEHQRNEQLKRQLGAERWKLELVLDDVLPALLQLGLFIFCLSFVLYLRTVNGTMWVTIAVLVGIAISIVVAAAVCTTWDRMCPYQSPLSHLFCWISQRIRYGIAITIRLCLAVMRCPSCFHGRDAESESPDESWNQRTRHERKTDGNKGRFGRLGRIEERGGILMAASVKRVILTSENTSALIHAAMNLCSIKNTEALATLANDSDFFKRLYSLLVAFKAGSRRSPIDNAAMEAVASALVHTTLSLGRISLLVDPEQMWWTPSLSISKRTMKSGWARHLINISYGLTAHVDTSDIPSESVYNRLRMLALLLVPLSSNPIRLDWMARHYARLAQILVQLRTSRPLFCAVTCAVKMGTLCDAWASDFVPHPSRKGEGPSIQYWQCTELLDVLNEFYSKSDGGVYMSVPFVSEAITPHLFRRWGVKLDWPELFALSVDILQHAYTFGVSFSETESAIYELWTSLERAIRQPDTTFELRQELQIYRSRLTVMLLDESKTIIPQDFAGLLGSILSPLTDSIAPDGPGHPENTAMLALLDPIWNRTAEYVRSNDLKYAEYKQLNEVYGAFKAWVDQGGYKEWPGRLSRDPEIGWCAYSER